MRMKQISKLLEEFLIKNKSGTVREFSIFLEIEKTKLINGERYE